MTEEKKAAPKKAAAPKAEKAAAPKAAAKPAAEKKAAAPKAEKSGKTLKVVQIGSPLGALDPLLQLCEFATERTQFASELQQHPERGRAGFWRRRPENPLIQPAQAGHRVANVKLACENHGLGRFHAARGQ